MRTAGVGRGNRHPAVPARSRLLTVCADQGGARRRCMDSPVQLDRVGALRNPPIPLSDAMRRVSPVRLGTTLRLAFPGRSIPPSGNQFRKSRFHAPVLCRATSFRGMFSCSLQRQGQGAGTLWHPQAQANAQFGECRWAGWKAGKLETGTWGLGMEMEVMCDKGCAACSVFLFCTNCSTSHLTLTPGVHCLSSSSFLPACPPCLSHFFSRPPSPCTLPTPALALAYAHARPDATGLTPPASTPP